MNKLSDSEKFKALQDHFVPHEKYSFPISVEYGKNRCGFLGGCVKWVWFAKKLVRKIPGSAPG